MPTLLAEAMPTKSPAAVPPPLALRSVVKRFHQGNNVVEALHEVSLTIAAGEFVAIIESFFRGQILIGVILGVLLALGFSMGRQFFGPAQAATEEKDKDEE